AANDWAATFKGIEGYLSTATFPVREVTIITDLRKTGWGGGVTEIANRWAGQSVSMRIIDVGSRQTQNLAVESFEMEDPIALPNGPVALKARIRNDTSAPVTAAQAVLTVAGESRPVILPELPAGRVTEIPLSVTMQKPGQ